MYTVGKVRNPGATLKCRDVEMYDQVAQWRKKKLTDGISYFTGLNSKSPCPITVKLKFEVSEMNW